MLRGTLGFPKARRPVVDLYGVRFAAGCPVEKSRFAA